jgi:AraC-like DNA-binding protein
MKNWTTLFSNPAEVAKLNTCLAKTLVYCPTLVEGGWNFRCVECHIATGTYASGHNFQWHSHEEYQIEVALTGAFKFEAEKSSTVTLRPGQALVIPWRLPHRWKCLKRGVMVGISLELTPTLAATRMDSSLFKRLTWLSGHPIRIRMFELINSASQDGHMPFHSTSTACRLFLFLAEVMRRVIPDVNEKSMEMDQDISEMRGGELVARIMRRLEGNLGLQITLSQVAQEVGLSSRQVHRLFIKHNGKSFHQWLMNQRLEYARKLLTQKGKVMQVKEIAFQCGFQSPTYFSNIFRKIYGFSPTTQVTGNAAMKSAATVKFLPPPDAKNNQTGSPTRHRRTPAAGLVSGRRAGRRTSR